jgi:hypothetical protein
MRSTLLPSLAEDLRKRRGRMVAEIYTGDGILTASVSVLKQVDPKTPDPTSPIMVRSLVEFLQPGLRLERCESFSSWSSGNSEYPGPKVNIGLCGAEFIRATWRSEDLIRGSRRVLCTGLVLSSNRC